MAILCSPVSTQLDGGEGHREARHVQHCAWQPGAAGNDYRGHAAPGGPLGDAARVGAPRARCLEALEAPANAVDLVLPRDVFVQHISMPYYARTVGLSSVGAARQALIDL
jgi:hypothetical protein